MALKAIFFDIDDCLFPSTRFAELARRNAVNAMVEAGLKGEPERVYGTLLKVIKKCGSNYECHFDVLLEEMRVKRDAKIIAAGISAYHNTKTSILPFPEVPRTLVKLRELGYKLYVASEGNAVKQWDKLIRMGIYLLFDDVFVSEEIGCEKSPYFFAKILKKLKLKASEAVMVGDRIDKDVASAKKAGIFTVRVIQEGKFTREKAVRKEEKADCVIKNVGELQKALKAIERKSRK
ncbi:MAG: TIGR02253 family HAD-type hydrolase [Candidatus Micrarchaeota archaeon]